MATILVLDDVPDYCEELAETLSRDGDTVRTASEVREAIDIGVLLEPDVLITDWMLSSHVNGLDVAEVLKQVYPAMQTILMTGYASRDLVENAKQFGVVDFLEKPFGTAAMRKALERAQISSRAKMPPAPIGIVETFSDGTIGHTNIIAEEMMSETTPGAFAVKLSEYFSHDGWLTVHRASLTEWVAMRPIGDKSRKWHLRSKEIQNTGVRVWAMLTSENVALKESAINLRLLGFSETIPKGLDHCGHILVVDEIPSVRKLAAEVLHAVRLFCHTASDQHSATRILTQDPEITHVVVDATLPDNDLIEFLPLAKGMKPDIFIIGSGAERDRSRFEKFGVTRFLTKPWDYSSVLELLRRANPEYH